MADAASLAVLRTAMEQLNASTIAVPPFEGAFLDRGHAAHFRCGREDVAGLRIDLMSRLRGVDDFEQLWARRTSILVDRVEVDMLAIEDLVRAKKTQRDKDWPRLLEEAYFSGPIRSLTHGPTFFRANSERPILLTAHVRNYPEQAARIAPIRPTVAHALRGTHTLVSTALAEEEAMERENDGIYWEPQKRELEQLRRAGRS